MNYVLASRLVRNMRTGKGASTEIKIDEGRASPEAQRTAAANPHSGHRKPHGSSARPRQRRAGQRDFSGPAADKEGGAGTLGKE